MPATRIAPLGAQELLHTVDIQANDPWCPTPVMLIAGERYFFRASGVWLDWRQIHDPNGAAVAHLKPFERLLRCKAQDATWFTLIGSIDKNPQSLFAIGDGLRWPVGWVATTSGQLRCFANDVRPMYFNNHGAISLQIWR
ncbi:hypothetical protein PHLH6_22930 [Pseudomonas sp. Seg1]|uniref:hypothetical protein n=1 Tax=unclassified Pseudomonas TaxID=196821 RepID=UPI000CD136A1|nr:MULTISPECIES: hypothetical protein [unclassified Pseudomonas]POA48803.1 hypothetical protein C1893_07745 [Pseudomonas sp. MPR-ANC1]BBP70289.1 hypothetical protein PHLH6_22930 [Pseudomonas sp. Seg1]